MINKLSLTYVLFLLSFTCGYCNIGGINTNIVQLNYPTNNTIKGVCVVAHGLNFKPSKMDWYEQIMIEQSVVTIRLNLKGHGSNYTNIDNEKSVEKARLNAFKDVKWEDWESDATYSLELAKKIADSAKVPIYVVGYSLGGLVMSSVSQKYDIKQLFLVAPALRSKAVLRVITKLLYLFPKLVIPSATPSIYRSNRGTTIRAYKALFYGERNLKKRGNLLKGSIIFLDKKDELVNSNYILKKFGEQNKIVVFSRKKQECDLCSYNHLMVDEVTLGDKSQLISNYILTIIEQ